MALSDWTSLIIPDGEKRWKAAGRKPKIDRKPEQRRNKVLAGIDNVLRQLAGNEENPRRGWYSTKGDVRRATVRLGARPLPLNGAETHAYISADRASDFYQGVRAHVESGAFDEAIARLYDKSDTSGRTRGGRARNARTASAGEAREGATEAAPRSKHERPSNTAAVATASEPGTASAESDGAAAPKRRSRGSATSKAGAAAKRGRTGRTKDTTGDASGTNGATEPARKGRPRKKPPAAPE